MRQILIDFARRLSKKIIGGYGWTVKGVIENAADEFIKSANPEQQIREQFANDLKARISAILKLKNKIWLSMTEVNMYIDETLDQVLPTEEEIKKMEE